MRTLYKLLTRNEWNAFLQSGEFTGSEVDRRDGFIHLSYADQLAGTARRHFTGVKDLILLAVSPARFGPALRDEVSRGGALFPHLYGALSIADVVWDRPIGLDAGGIPTIPPPGRDDV